MDYGSLIKTQMLLGAGGATGHNSLYNFIALNGIEVMVKSYPVWFGYIKSWCSGRRNKSSSNPILSSSLRTPRAEITCEKGIPSSASQTRNNAPQQSIYSSRIDSVVHYVTTLPAMKTLLAVTHHDYLPNAFEPISLENDVLFELLDMKVSDGQIEQMKFKLFCYDHDVQHLQAFIDTCSADYERRQLNKLGVHRYYFDQIVQTKSKKSLQNPLPHTHLMYTKSKFITNRNFSNVFFEERSLVQSRTDHFLNNRSWYDKKGIPYTLGFMFHGTPGCGKTSTVKAIASEGRRHIINVQLSEIRSKAQLQHLFFNDDIHVFNGLNAEKFTIPVSERLYVIEDIDAMGDSVLRREWKKPVDHSTVQKKQEDPMFAKGDDDDRDVIDLSFLLNLLDGTLESNGRILVITTNFPERIDKALIRPGRVDMIIKFKKCNIDVLREMVHSFYETKIDIADNKELEYKWSPAEVNQILFRNFDNPQKALDDLVSLSHNDLYGFIETPDNVLPTLE